MFSGIKERDNLLLVLLFSAACLFFACGGGGDGGGDGGNGGGEPMSVQGEWYGVTTTQTYGREISALIIGQNEFNLHGDFYWVQDGFLYVADDVTGSVDGATVNISVRFPNEKIEYGFVGTLRANEYSGNIDLYMDSNLVERGTFLFNKDEAQGGDPEPEPEPQPNNVGCQNQYLLCRIQLCGSHLDSTCTMTCYHNYTLCLNQQN